MKKYQKEIIKLTSKEVLLSIFDMAVPFFEASSVYRVDAKEYKRNRENERIDFVDKVYYLKKMGYIDTFVEGKGRYIEITPRGLNRVNKIKNTDNISINRPENWDGKWRVVIFDIPEKYKYSRDIFRCRLVNLGFEKVQESVYVYPFECTGVIGILSRELLIENNVIIMISEIIQGEREIIAEFIDKGVLCETDLKN